MSDLQHKATILNTLIDADLSKILGLTVDIELNNNEEKITGMIYSLLKQRNFLILLKDDDAEANQIQSIFINIGEIRDIRISQRKMNIDFDDYANPSIDKILENEKIAVEKDDLLKNSEKNDNQEKNHAAYQKGYLIYDKLSKFYKCTYKGERICLDELDVYIDKPFGVENIFCEDESTRKRIKKLFMNGDNSNKNEL